MDYNGLSLSNHKHENSSDDDKRNNFTCNKRKSSISSNKSTKKIKTIADDGT